MKRMVPVGIFALSVAFCVCFLPGCKSMDSSGQAEQQRPSAEVQVPVPNLIGDDLESAVLKLRQSGLNHEAQYDDNFQEKAGTVVAQFPEAGSFVSTGQTVRLTVSERATVTKKVVCLDPGHADTPYSIDPDTGLNTMDWANEPEIEMVYDIAIRAKALLETQGIEVVVTKQSVYDPVDLKQRAVIANQAGAAMILHIHTDPGISAPTTFYPGGDSNHNWKANSDSGRKAVIDPTVQAASQRFAEIFHSAMTLSLSKLTGVSGGGLQIENRGATGTGNYGPIFSYDIWSQVPTFTIENNQSFANNHRQEVAQSIADGLIACLEAR